jgi:hypothetical protein
MNKTEKTSIAVMRELARQLRAARHSADGGRLATKPGSICRAAGLNS